MTGYAPEDTIKYWNGSVANGTLKETQLDAAAERVLLTRFRAGEFDEDHPFRSLDVPTGVVNSPAHRALARETAAKTAVLLANSDGVLPLDMAGLANSRMLVTGPFARAFFIEARRSRSSSKPVAMCVRARVWSKAAATIGLTSPH